MGGYGGASGRIKDKCYYDTGGHKVKDKNAIEVAEHYIEEGKYVAFLQEKNGQPRADLSVEGQHIEVKGLSSVNPDNIEKKSDMHLSRFTVMIIGIRLKHIMREK